MADTGGKWQPGPKVDKGTTKPKRQCEHDKEFKEGLKYAAAGKFLPHKL